jgi:hypothetical protein
MSASRKTWQAIVAPLLALGAIGMLSLQAKAASDVQGRPDEVTLRADKATVEEILQALSAKFKITYKLPVGIDRLVDGTFTGTLNEVLARILDGQDYVIETLDGHVSLAVLARRGPAKADIGTNQARRLTEAVASPSTAAIVQPLADRQPSPALPTVPPLATFLSSNGTVGIGGGAP